MQIKHDIFETQYPILKDFVCHLVYYRVLFRIYTDDEMESDFWVRTINAHLLRAMIDWCMVFGSDSNEVHWKKVMPFETDQQNFRALFTDQLEISMEEWGEYRKAMTTFRDKFAAHRTLGILPAPPCLDVAVNIVFAYDCWIRKSLADTYFDESFLEDSYWELHSEFIDQLQELMRYSEAILCSKDMSTPICTQS